MNQPTQDQRQPTEAEFAAISAIYSSVSRQDTVEATACLRQHVAQETAKLRDALTAIEASPMAPFDSFEAALNRAKSKATEALT